MTSMTSRFGFVASMLAALAVVVGVSIGTVATAHAQAGAQAFLQQKHEQVRGIMKRPAAKPEELAARNAKLSETIGQLLDYEELSKRALDEHWATLPADKRSEFVSLLARLVERNYQQNLESTLDFKVRYTGEAHQGTATVVQTFARSKKNGRAPEVAIDYTLVNKDGAWKVFDVTTDGVSLVNNYRTQFGRIIRKDGIDALLARMKKRLDSGDGVL